MGRRTDKIVSLFVKTIKDNIPSSKIILFGSRAKGVATAESDYDFLVISPTFRRWEWEKRSAKIYNLKKDIPAASVGQK